MQNLLMRQCRSENATFICLAKLRIPWRTRPASENVARSRHSDCGDGAKRCEQEKTATEAGGVGSESEFSTLLFLDIFPALRFRAALYNLNA